MRLIVLAAEVISTEEASRVVSTALGQPPGEIVRADKSCLWVQTGDGVLALTRVQPAGKRVMEIAEFLRGYAPRPGQQL